MKKLITAVLFAASATVMADTATQVNEAPAFEDVMTFELNQQQHTIDLQQLLAFELPDIVVNPPRCYGFQPLCDLTISILMAGRTDIPAGCHYSGAVGSDVYYCEIE